MSDPQKNHCPRGNIHVTILKFQKYEVSFCDHTGSAERLGKRSCFMTKRVCLPWRHRHLTPSQAKVFCVCLLFRRCRLRIWNACVGLAICMSIIYVTVTMWLAFRVLKYALNILQRVFIQILFLKLHTNIFSFIYIFHISQVSSVQYILFVMVYFIF